MKLEKILERLNSIDKNNFIKVIDNIISQNIPKDSYFEQWNLSQLEKDIEEIFKIKKDINKIGKKEGVADEEIKEIILKEIKNFEEKQEKEIGEKNLIKKCSEIIVSPGIGLRNKNIELAKKLGKKI